MNSTVVKGETIGITIGLSPFFFWSFDAGKSKKGRLNQRQLRSRIILLFQPTQTEVWAIVLLGRKRP